MILMEWRPVTRNVALGHIVAVEAVAYCAAPTVPFHPFGAVLRELRQQAGLTQVHLAEQLGAMTQGHVSALEHGGKQPSLGLVVHLADFFGVTTDSLLRST